MNEDHRLDALAEYVAAALIDGSIDFTRPREQWVKDFAELFMKDFDKAHNKILIKASTRTYEL